MIYLTKISDKLKFLKYSEISLQPLLPKLNCSITNLRNFFSPGFSVFQIRLVDIDFKRQVISHQNWIVDPPTNTP